MLKPQPGTAMLFTGDVTHAGLPVATGRVVLVASFCNVWRPGRARCRQTALARNSWCSRVAAARAQGVPGGTVQYYGGEREVQRLVRVEYPDNDVEHYGGERGAERMVRAVRQQRRRALRGGRLGAAGAEELPTVRYRFWGTLTSEAMGKLSAM